MYAPIRDRPVDVPTRPAGDGAEPKADGVDGNVVSLGMTSFFTDISSEMVNAVLPLYLTVTLGFTPLQFGLFDGTYQGVTGLVRIGGGVVADRGGRYKEVAGFGYAISAACKLALLASQAWTVTTAALLVDRTGKGIRTAPRDALISLSSRRERLAESFGVHRALDTAGALLGPVVAFLVLGLAPRAYDAVFVASFCFALVGLGVLGCFVRNRRPAARPEMTAPSWRAALGLLRRPRFRRLVVAGGLLSLVTISDAFIYLAFQRRTGMAARPFPLLFVGTALAYLVLAIPFGRLADRVGRTPVFVAGHVLLALAYLVLWTGGPGLGGALLLLGLLGAYYAATDGVLMALASAALPSELRSSGLALLTTGTALARFAGALTFGLLWTWRGPEGAVPLFLATLVVVLPVSARILFSRPAEERS